ncbi:MAG TPA: outer membrane lipoprotein carrier protein LolA [Bacteroidales bacterium]|nr:outer membrane lipoprotein carrier protein LolA [Bacteroidales bacterium]HRZ76562.1 outer membrane lipoprotein carrier protein LolA [Bacteroidales bacterium]
MIKNRISLSLAITLLLTLPFLSPAQEGDKRSQQILKEVADKTAAMETIQVKFAYTMDNNSANIHESYEGTLLIKGNAYRLNVGGQQVICDGKTIWTYIADAEEVQIHDASTGSEGITPSMLLTSYHKDYKSKLIKEGLENGVKSWVIDLVPIKGKSFFKVRVVIDQAKKQITSFTIFEKNGSTFTYRIKEFKPNVAAGPEKFSFRKTDFPGAEIIDMR